MSFVKNCEKPISINTPEKYAYQCPDININSELEVIAFIPRPGLEPCTIKDKEDIKEFEFKITKHTGKALSICFTTHFKSGKEKTYATTLSLTELVNRIFENHEANYFEY